MGYLPPKTNQHYRGQSWAVGILALAAVHTLGVALAKLALPDSGLISLGGLNLAHEGGLQMVAMAARGGRRNWSGGWCWLLLCCGTAT